MFYAFVVPDWLIGGIVCKSEQICLLSSCSRMRGGSVWYVRERRRDFGVT